MLRLGLSDKDFKNACPKKFITSFEIDRFMLDLGYVLK